MRVSAWQAAKEIAESDSADSRRNPAKPVKGVQSPRNPARPAKPYDLTGNTRVEVRPAPLARQRRDVSGLRTLLTYRQRPGGVYACRITMAYGCRMMADQAKLFFLLFMPGADNFAFDRQQPVVDQLIQPAGKFLRHIHPHGPQVITYQRPGTWFTGGGTRAHALP